MQFLYRSILFSLTSIFSNSFFILCKYTTSPAAYSNCFEDNSSKLLFQSELPCLLSKFLLQNSKTRFFKPCESVYVLTTFEAILVSKYLPFYISRNILKHFYQILKNVQFLKYFHFLRLIQY